MFDIVVDPFLDVHLKLFPHVLKKGAKIYTCGIASQTKDYTDKAKLLDYLPMIIANNYEVIGNCLGSTNDLKNAISDVVSGKLNINQPEIHDAGELQDFLDKILQKKLKFGKSIFKYS